ADHVLKPSQALNGICVKGCTIRLNDTEDDEYQLEESDVVSIEDGSLFYDGSDTAAAQLPAGGDKPAGKQYLILSIFRPRCPSGRCGAFRFLGPDFFRRGCQLERRSVPCRSEPALE